MLIAMTFNGAYFAAVVFGFGLGALLLGHLKENYQRHIGVSGGAAAADPEFCCGVGVVVKQQGLDGSAGSGVGKPEDGGVGVALNGGKAQLSGNGTPTRV